MNKLIKKGFLALTLFSCITMVGCVGEQGPAGPQGEPGIQGEPGHTPNIAIGENGNWFIDGVDTGVNCRRGGDDTIYTTVDGIVKYERVGKNRKQASCYPVEVK